MNDSVSQPSSVTEIKVKETKAGYWSMIVGFVLLILLLMQNFFLRWENQVLRNVQEITKVEHTLLQDQLRDYEHKLANTRTYDEGYMAAMLRSSDNKEYVEGYHNAMAQVFNTSMICDTKYQDLKEKFEEEKSKVSQKPETDKPVLESSVAPIPKGWRFSD